MFTRHAKFAGFHRPKFGSVGLRQVGPHWPEAAHANDNLQGFRRPAGQRRSPPLKLACRWVLTGANRLECRWHVEDLDGASVEEPDGSCITGKKSGFPALTVGRRHSRAAAHG